MLSSLRDLYLIPDGEKLKLTEEIFFSSFLSFSILYPILFHILG
jgi:hypothetical protein